MLYVLHGSDTHTSRDKLHALLQTLLGKKKDAMLIKITNENFDPRELLEHIKSQGLFEQKSIIVLDHLFEDATDKGIVLDNIKDISASENVFILLEGLLDKKTITKLEKHAEKVQECTLPDAPDKKESFNIFGLSDALGARDRKQLWVMYQTGKLHNVSDEEMHGILFWSVKNMLLARTTHSASEAALSPFVYKKASIYEKNYSQQELTQLSKQLVMIYHEARRGSVSLSTALEQMVLGL